MQHIRCRKGGCEYFCVCVCVSVYVFVFALAQGGEEERVRKSFTKEGILRLDIIKYRTSTL